MPKMNESGISKALKKFYDRVKPAKKTATSKSVVNAVSEPILGQTEPPPNISSQHLKNNGQLLTQKEQKKVKKYFEKHPDKNFYQNKSLPFPVVKTKENQLLVLYVKPEDLFSLNTDELKQKIKDEKIASSEGIYPLGVGKFGVVVAAQAMDGSWGATKFETTVSSSNDLKNKLDSSEMEHKALKSQPNLFKGAATLKAVVGDQECTVVMTAMAIGPGKDLNEAIVDETGKNILTDSQKLDIGAKVSAGADHMIKSNLVHRDFKSNNVMADPKTGKVMLIDFGGAGELNAKGEFVQKFSIGTEGYEAPELLRGAFLVEPNVQSETSMAFALGMTLAELFTHNNLTYIPDDNWKKHYQDFPLDQMFYQNMLACFSDVLGNSPALIETQTIIEREMSKVVHDLIHLDPNQRITMESAQAKLQVIKDYHALLENQQIPLAKGAAESSIQEHMNTIKAQNPSNIALVGSIEKLQAQMVQIESKDMNNKVDILQKRLSNYIDKLGEPKDQLAVQHKQNMQLHLAKLQNIDPKANDASYKLETARNQIYSEQSLFDLKKTQEQLNKNAAGIKQLLGDTPVKNQERYGAASSAFQESNDKLAKLLATNSSSPTTIAALYVEVRKLNDSLIKMRVYSTDDISKKTYSMGNDLVQLERKLAYSENLYNEMVVNKKLPSRPLPTPPTQATAPLQNATTIQPSRNTLPSRPKPPSIPPPLNVAATKRAETMLTQYGNATKKPLPSPSVEPPDNQVHVHSKQKINK
jgi:serine/threonine protein kinase